MAPNHSDDEGTDSEEGSEVDDNEEEEGSEEEEEPEPVKPAPKKRKSRKKKKDPKKPKRNMSACFLYFQAFRPQVRAENPDAKFADIVSHNCCLCCFLAWICCFSGFSVCMGIIVTIWDLCVLMIRDVIHMSLEAIVAETTRTHIAKERRVS